MDGGRDGLSRRRFLRLGAGSLAGVYALGLTACGDGETGAAGQGQATGAGGGGGGAASIRMSWWGNDTRHEAVREALGIYEQDNPNITVTTEPVEWSAYWNRLATQTAGGNAPDLLQMDMGYIADYANRGVLLDLRPFVGDAIDLSGFDEGINDSGTIDGALYGITFGINTQMLVHNQELAAAAGVELPREGWTWEDFARLTTQISSQMGDGVWGTVDEGGYITMFEIFVRQAGRELTGPEGELDFRREDLAEWLTYWDDLRRTGGATPGDVTAQALEGAEFSPVVQGTAAMDASWTPSFSAFAAASTSQLGLGMAPTRTSAARPGQFIKPASYLSVAASTAVPDATAALIDFLVNDPAAIDALGVEIGVPPTEQAREQIAPDLEPQAEKVLDYIELVSENATPLPRPWAQGHGEIRTLLQRINEQVAFDELTVDDAVDLFFSEAEQALA